jgi:signal peptidase I
VSDPQPPADRAVDDRDKDGPALGSPSQSSSIGGAADREDPAPKSEPLAVPPDRERKRSSRRRSIIQWVVILAIAVLAAVLLRVFVVQPFKIPSGSMEPTLKPHDRVLVDKLSYDLHSIHRGDVIVFKKPPDDNTPGIKDLIKRVIGLPGETIAGKNRQIYINGKPLSEHWLPKVNQDTTSNFGPVQIPAGEYFVMGDNRVESTDSRVFGPIPKSLVIGRAFIIVWPLSRVGTL